jgi:hypothetical protein
MEFVVITPRGCYLLMETDGGEVVQVWPAPPDSLPPAGAPAQPTPGR